MNHSIGLVLEGGGLRGIYTAGVLDIFLREGIQLRDVYAVSAGACHACSYLAMQPGRAYHTNTAYLDDPRYCSFRSLLSTGDLFDADFLYHELPEKLYPIDNETFLSIPSRFHPVITNCLTGRAEYPQVRDLLQDVDYVRASASLPGVSRFVMINGIPYLDGGISDAIPLARSITEGHCKNVVILTRDRTYRKTANKFTTLFKQKYRAYPALCRQLDIQHLAYNAALSSVYQAEQDGSAFVIAPSVPLELGRLEKNREKIDAVYQQGRHDAEEKLSELLSFLSI